MATETDLTIIGTDIEPSLDAAVTDSPSFRACVANFEDQVEALERWLDHLCKLIKTYSDDLSKLNEDSKALAKKVVPSSGEGIIDPDLSMEILHIFANCLQNSFAFEDKLVSDIDSNLLQPLTAFIKDDFRELKETRRANDKAQEKYEAALARYAAVSKAKEASALREDAFQLYEIRKAYVRASMAYTLKIVKFRASLDHLVIEQFVSMTLNQLEHHGSSYQIYKSVKSSLDQLNYRLGESHATYEYKLKKLQKVKKSLEDEVIQSARPNTLLQAYFPSPGQPAYYNPSSVPSTTIDDNNPEKEGYLFKRVAAKTLGIESWTRRWFWLREGKFGYSMTSTTGKLRGQVVSGGHLQVLLCEARMRTSDVGDRRFCFEVVSSRKNFLLQAETEEEMNDWLTVFSKAKTKEMQSASSEVIASIAYNFPVGPTVSSSVPPLKRSPPTSASNLIATPSAETTEVSPISSKGLNISDFEGGKCDTVVVDDALIPAGEASTSAAISGSQPPPTVPPTINSDATISDTSTPPVSSAPSKHAVMFQDHHHQMVRKSNTVIGDKFISLLSGSGGSTPPISSPPPITVAAAPTSSLNIGNAAIIGDKGLNGENDSPEIPEWKKNAIEIGLPEHLMQRNDEIRLLNKSLPPRDCVVEVFMCTLEREHACLRGRAYLTQWNFCFYSSVMSLVTSFIIPFARIESIVFENHDLYSTIAITELATTPGLTPNPSTPNKSIPPQKTCTTFKVYTTNNVKIYNNLCFAWKNVAERACLGNPPLPLSDLYNGIVEQSQRMDDEDKERGFVEESDGGPGEMLFVSKPNAPRRYHSETDVIKKKNRPPETDAPPPSIQVPPVPVQCNCTDHLDEKRIDITFPIPVIRLWDMLFGGDAPHAPGGVWVRAYQKKKNIVLSRSPWSPAQSNDFAKFGLPETENVEKRDVVYTLQVSNPMSKIKETECIETQLILLKDEYRCYVVITSAKAAALPYSDAFSPQIKYCLMHAGTGKSRLLAHLGIKWFKSPMVKGIIKTAATAGMSDTVVDLVAVIQEDIRAAGRKVQEPGKSLGHMQFRLSEGDRGAESPTLKDGTTKDNENATNEFGQNADIEDTEKIVPRETWVMKMMKLSPLEFIEVRNLMIAVLSCCLIWMLWTGRGAKSRSSPRPGFSFDPAGGCLVPDTLAEMEEDATRWVPDLVTQRGGDSKEVSSPTSEEGASPLPKVPVGSAETNCAPAIAWRAVYLRDLEEGILKRSELPPKYQPAFDRFLQSQISRQPGADTEPQPVVQSSSQEEGEDANFESEGKRVKSYPWFLHDHFKASQKIALRRNRIAIMRHEILADLHRLNGLDRSLVLAEYMNWLMDETVRCETSMHLAEEGTDESSFFGRGNETSREEVKQQENNNCILLKEQIRRLQTLDQ